MSANSLMHRAEKGVFYILGGVIVLYIAIEVIELVYQFAKALFADHSGSDRLLVTKEHTKLVLPVFFNILIAVELLDTMKNYIAEHSIKVQSILLIGLIAIGRKILVLDVGHADGLTNLGLAAMIIALSGGYYLVKRAG
jgi:uncharacterized membrane protein (DUF373 family)